MELLTEEYYSFLHQMLFEDLLWIIVTCEQYDY